MGWTKSVSTNGMGRNGMDPIDIWAQMGWAEMGWAESGGYPKKVPKVFAPSFNLCLRLTEVSL